ncbi:MAG: ketose-bisphosphate aldolase [Candidatus Nealsonbacteria bacterium CG23_combo_of_CG06-09_8_20_14_all_36_12]|uniref:Ketose-bisphosphate aldolase n=2 Tax=Candidatus Nealsoniibacteriota TaxID=1817911 RepID=A0A2H0TKS0_9BACT|nr:MAG: ketose-bisphosphate aldolase [Candidatus Nealsonbacteria bacterium CG23_combo_of_CG06-09_8_20_14_all_36_12]PIR72755.1 MAG: ketose-bisphosphate aldolase [Candidatus Nealsonbacteria bacterium CG10_big_fil_rev_8_21_14_0_10_36_23]
MKLKQILKKAQKEGWAIGQFNFSTFEQLKGILMAAKKLRSPIILGTSEGESKFLGCSVVIPLVYGQIFELKVNPESVFLNLDHGKNFDWIEKVVKVGYQMVHFDGSNLSFKENIKRTKKVADYAKRKGVLVEGELGKIEAVKKGFKIKKENLTDPEKVREFVKKTKVDSLAISIGNLHGIAQKMEKLDFERLKEIRKKINVFLVLHGGSGIPKNEIKKAIKNGISKININTELRLAWRKSLEKSLRLNKGEIKPYKILPSVSEAVQKVVEEKIRLFGSYNKI